LYSTLGDRIHVSNPDNDTSTSGSLSWIVKDVDLYTTTVVLAATGEKATLSNGSLASSRVINMARSPNASLFITLRFAVDTPYSKIEIFEEALRKFVKSKPREWVQLVSFRANNMLQDLGYVEYMVSLQHRESWQNPGILMMSKARVASFCLELSNKLDMRYRSPPLPVDLTIANKESSGADSVIAKFQAPSSTAGDDVALMFKGEALEGSLVN
jgi:small-conductance mechanosensitive channel